MARQSGGLKLEGTIGNIIFYKRNGKYFARQKGGVSKKRFRSAPEFEGSRQAGKEFGRASAISGILRRSLFPVLKGIEKLGHPKLTAVIQQVIKTDAVSERGSRRFCVGDSTLVDGLELDNDSVASILGGLPSTTLLGESNQVRFEFNKLGKISADKIPAGSSHFEVSVFVVKINEDEGVEGGCTTYVYHIASLDQEISLMGAVEIGVREVSEDTHLGEDSHFGKVEETIIGAVSVRFYQFVNGGYYRLSEGGGVCILKVFSSHKQLIGSFK